MKVYVVVDDCTDVVDCHEIYTYVCATEKLALKKVRELCKQAFKCACIEDEDSYDEFIDDSSYSSIFSSSGIEYTFQFNQRSFILDDEDSFYEHCYIEEKEVIE